MKQHLSLKSPLRFHDNRQHRVSVLLRSSSPRCWCKRGAGARQWTVSLHGRHQPQQQRRSDVIHCGDFPPRPSSLLRFSLFDIKLRPQRVRRLSEVAPKKSVRLFVYCPPRTHFLCGRRLPLHSSVILSAAWLPPRCHILLTDALILPSSATAKILQCLESV